LRGERLAEINRSFAVESGRFDSGITAPHVLTHMIKHNLIALDQV